MDSIASLLKSQRYEKAKALAKELIEIVPNDENANLGLLLAECKVQSLEELKYSLVSIEKASSFENCIKVLSLKKQTQVLNAISDQLYILKKLFLKK